MDPYVFINGKIIDETSKNPIPGVKVTFQQIKTITDETGIFQLKIPIPFTVTDPSGNISFTAESFVEIQNSNKFTNLPPSERSAIRQSLLVNFSKSKYSSNASILPFEGTGEWIPDLGLIQLIPQNKQLDLDTASAKLPSDTEKDILTSRNKTNNIKAGITASLQISLDTMILKVKNSLIPLILLLLASFGVTLEMVTKNLLDKKTCPDNKKLLEIINRRNKIVTQLNNLYTAVNTVAKATTALSGFLQVLQISLQIAKAVPAPAPAGASSTLIALENKLGKIVYTITGISFASLLAAATLKQILDLLSALDLLIQQCSIDKNVSLVAINTDIRKAATSTNNDLYNGTIEYKGFKFEIQEDTKDNNKYIKRYAIARDTSGTIVLRGESSFSASTQILIDELKFIIDRDNLKAF